MNETKQVQPVSEISPSEWTITLVLCIFLGGWGVHRFYVGKVGTGLLMIFTLGMKFCYKNDSGGLNISQIKKEELEEINQHFQSFGFTLLVERFTIHDYLSNMKTPNYFKDKHLIKETTLLRDIYYESVIEGYIYRITFDFLQ